MRLLKTIDILYPICDRAPSFTRAWSSSANSNGKLRLNLFQLLNVFAKGVGVEFSGKNDKNWNGEIVEDLELLRMTENAEDLLVKRDVIISPSIMNQTGEEVLLKHWNHWKTIETVLFETPSKLFPSLSGTPLNLNIEIHRISPPFSSNFTTEFFHHQNHWVPTSKVIEFHHQNHQISPSKPSEYKRRERAERLEGLKAMVGRKRAGAMAMRALISVSVERLRGRGWEGGDGQREGVEEGTQALEADSPKVMKVRWGCGGGRGTWLQREHTRGTKERIEKERDRGAFLSIFMPKE